MAARVALYLALPCLAELRAAENAAENAAAAVAAVAKHFLVQGAGTRRLFKEEEEDPFNNLDAGCRAELQPLVATLNTPACKEEFAQMNKMTQLTNRNVEDLCTSSCFDTALEVLDHDCFAKMVDGGSSDANNGLGLYVDIVRVMCVKNEHGDYCGTKMGVLLSGTANPSEQCGVAEDMGCCFAEVADIVSSFIQQQGAGSVDYAGVVAAACSDHDIEMDKCPDHFGLSAGAIAGIVLGCLALVACIGVAVFFAIRAGKKAPAPAAEPRMLLGQPQPQHAVKDVAWPSQEP